MCKVHRSREVGQIQYASMHGLHLFAVGQACTMGLLANCTLVTGVLVVRKLLVVPESKMANLLMVFMSMLTV